ncbi:MAG: hypothetical protein ABI835_18525, partial [Chloroflexota bacterium]
MFTEKLQVSNALTARLGTILNLKILVRELAQAAREVARCERAVVVYVDSEKRTLSIAAIAADDSPSFKRTPISYDPNDVGIWGWIHHEAYFATPEEIAAESSLAPLMQALGMDGFYSLPLHIADALAGIILVDNPSDHRPI